MSLQNGMFILGYVVVLGVFIVCMQYRLANDRIKRLQKEVEELQKVGGALKPGGCVATLEFVPNEDRVSPPMPAAFSMTMLTSTASGDAHTFRELSDMHDRAGFTAVSEDPIPMSPQTVVMAKA